MKIKLVTKKDYPGVEKFRKAFEISEKGKMCIAIGGDGTFLRAAKEYDGPILHIRPDETETMGYFSDVTLNDAEFVIEKLKKEEYTTETLGRKVEVFYKGKSYHAVNEVSLHNISDAIRFKIFRVRNGKRKMLLPFVVSGDGMLIATSMGSTAYNKSAGGPIIINPGTMCITFMLVDAPIKNSFVVGEDDEFDIEIVKGKGVLRTDGDDIGMLDVGDSFHVRTSKKAVNVIKFPEKSEDFEDKLERVIKSRIFRSVTS